MAIVQINAGDLRTPLVHQRPLRVRGLAENGFTITWATKRTLLCAIRPIQRADGGTRLPGGQEIQFAGKRQAIATHVINCRAQDYIILPDSRLVENNQFVYNIISAIQEQRVRNVMRIFATQSIYSDDSTVDESMAFEHITDEIDFTVNQTISFNIASGYRLYHDEEEAVCTTLSGSVVTQPTISIGISSNTTKYLNARTTTLLTTANVRQVYQTLGANDGEQSVLITIVGGAVSGGGSYRGKILVRGVLVAS